jgi:protein tyrosine/serine phosphatase
MKLGFSTAPVTLILVAALLLSGCHSSSAVERQVLEPNVTPTAPCRAGAVRIEKPGLPNLYRVSEDLYRGAQPTAEGFRQLKTMGVKTVINLRVSCNDREEIAGAGLAYEEIPMTPWHAENEDAVRFLKLVADGSRAPFFVHCYYGADRTGMLCAVYRIVIQGWTKDEAIAEMTQGGFGFHPIWRNLVAYLRKLDVEKLKRQAFHSRAQEIFIFGPAQAWEICRPRSV